MLRKVMLCAPLTLRLQDGQRAAGRLYQLTWLLHALLQDAQTRHRQTHHKHLSSVMTWPQRSAKLINRPVCQLLESDIDTDGDTRSGRYHGIADDSSNARQTPTAGQKRANTTCTSNSRLATAYTDAMTYGDSNGNQTFVQRAERSAKWHEHTGEGQWNTDSFKTAVDRLSGIDMSENDNLEQHMTDKQNLSKIN